MSTRARVFSSLENQVGQPNLAGVKRATGLQTQQPGRAALGTINVNTRHTSVGPENAGVKSLKPTNFVRKNVRDVAPAPKKVEDELEKMEMSIVKDEDIETAIEDIDAADLHNPQLVTEYVTEIYSYLRSVEESQAINPEYLSGQSEILPKMRSVLIDWLVGVHLQFHLLQETLYTTVAILDRFLQVDISNITRKKLQLVGVASMLVAAKYEEIYAPEVKDFVYITDKAYTEKDILKMEIKILHVLNFDLGRPLPLHFLRRASKAGCVDAATHTLAKYIVELSLGVYSLSSVAPSKLAAAGLVLSMRLLEPSSTLDGIWSPSLIHYTKYALTDLHSVITSLAEVLFLAPSAKLATVYNKYANKKFMKISRIPILDDPVLKRLAKGDKL